MRDRLSPKSVDTRRGTWLEVSAGRTCPEPACGHSHSFNVGRNAMNVCSLSAQVADISGGRALAVSHKESLPFRPLNFGNAVAALQRLDMPAQIALAVANPIFLQTQLALQTARIFVALFADSLASARL